MNHQAKYLANAINPTVTILVRAVRADHKAQGYQATAYWDRPASRVQLILANLLEENHWRICADAVLLSYEKIMVRPSSATTPNSTSGTAIIVFLCFVCLKFICIMCN